MASPFSNLTKELLLLSLSYLVCVVSTRIDSFRGSCEEYIALLECKIVKLRGIVQRAPSSDQNRERSIEHCSKAES